MDVAKDAIKEQVIADIQQNESVPFVMNAVNDETVNKNIQTITV